VFDINFIQNSPAAVSLKPPRLFEGNQRSVAVMRIAFMTFCNLLRRQGIGLHTRCAGELCTALAGLLSRHGPQETFMRKTQFLAAALIAGTLIGNVALAEGAGKAVDDSWITTKVKTDLAKDKGTSATKIHVNTKAGVVVLTGTVPSAAEKEKAEQDARSVKGVVDVENQLTVAP